MLSGCPEDLEQCVATGVVASCMKEATTPGPSLLAIIVEHPEDSVLFHALPYLCPIHEQYLGMLDVDVVIRMLQRTNAENANAVVTVTLDWYNHLGETQAFDNTHDGFFFCGRMFVVTQKRWCGPVTCNLCCITSIRSWNKRSGPSRRRLTVWRCFYPHSHTRMPSWVDTHRSELVTTVDGTQAHRKQFI